MMDERGARELPRPRWQTAWVLARVTFAILALAAAIWGLGTLADRLEVGAWLRAFLSEPWRLTLVLIVYAILLAIPFVPGIEIGIVIMILFGAMGAATVYVAAVSGLMGSFLVGRFVPERRIRRLLRRLGMRNRAPSTSWAPWVHA